MQFVPIRVISVFFAIAAWVVGCGFSILAADEEPRVSENLSQASPSATVQAEEKTEAQTSPKGTFKIESETKSPPPGIEGTDVADFVVSTTDPKVREPLDDHPDTTAVSYIISPDEKWIYEEKTYGHLMTGGELYERGEGLKFQEANKSQSFAEMVWRFFAKEERIEPDDVPSPSGGRDCCEGGLIDFAGWSSDSGRLLVGLRGGDFDGQRSRGVYRWFVYFNTENRNFELTKYLRRLNKGAWDRYANFSEDNPDVGLVEEVIAEPLSELPPEAESKKRYEKADRHVNELYQKVGNHGSQEAQANWSRIRKQWIRNREAGAKFYALSGPKRTAGSRYWLLMADSTEAHASVIENALKKESSNE